MKRNLLLIGSLLICYSVNAQVILSVIFGDKLNAPGVEFGLEAAVNYSRISNLESQTSNTAFNLGFYFDIQLKEQWNLYTGVMVKSTLGSEDLTPADLSYLITSIDETDGQYDHELKYFLIPILIKYNLPNRIYFETGPQMGWLRKAELAYYETVDSRRTEIKEEITDQFNRFDAGFVAGAGYKLMEGTGMTLGVKYYHGLVNVFQAAEDGYNRSWFLKLNIPIGANKNSLPDPPAN